MQRWLTDQRRRWVLIGLLLAVGVLVVVPLVVERAALARVKAKASARGLAFEADSTSLGFSGLTFAGVSVRANDGRELVKAERLAARVSLWDLWGGAAAALREVELHGASLDFSVDDLTRLRKGSADSEGAAQPSEAAKTPRDLPSVRADDVAFTLRDAAGVLLRTKGLQAALAEGRFEATVPELTLGAAPGEVAALTGAELRGELVEGRPVISYAGVQSARFTWAPEGDEQQDADGFPPARGRTVARVKAVRAALRGQAEDEAAQEIMASARRLPWSDDAKLELKDTRVVSVEPDGTSQVMLDKLAARVEARGAHELRAQGSGVEPRGGRVSWDLRLVPKEARVEGKLNLHDMPLALLGPVLPPLPFYELDQTRLEADLELTGVGLESVAVKGALTVRDLGFASEGLARTPVGPFTFEANGEGTWTPARRELSNMVARIKTGGVEVSLSGVLAWPRDGYRVDFLAEMPKTPCGRVLSAVPAGLLDELSTMEIAGSLGGKLLVHVDAADLDNTKVDFDIKDQCKFGALPTMLDLGRFQRPFVHAVLEPDGTLFEMETGPGTGAWTPIEHVSPFLIQAVVAHEDGRFFTHHGFAEPEIGVALSRNLKAKAFRFGASTITMQLVKNVFLQRDKLLSRKVQEALIVWWLEQHWDKRRIMELYLNVIEYGPAIYGIRNAALHYFGTIPMNLTPAQAAFLATILPSPKSAYVHYEKGTLSNSTKNRTASLLKHMHLRQRIDDEALAYGLEELETFRFYNPSLPPPLPPQIRGTAQKPPFNMPEPTYESWDAVPFDFGMKETGSFGAP